MNYEKLNCCCFVEIKSNLWKYILFWKLSSLLFFLCVVCFVYKTAMIVYITREQRIWQVVWVLVNC